MNELMGTHGNLVQHSRGDSKTDSCLLGGGVLVHEELPHVVGRDAGTDLKGPVCTWCLYQLDPREAQDRLGLTISDIGVLTEAVARLYVPLDGPLQDLTHVPCGVEPAADEPDEVFPPGRRGVHVLLPTRELGPDGKDMVPVDVPGGPCVLGNALLGLLIRQWTPPISDRPELSHVGPCPGDGMVTCEDF